MYACFKLSHLHEITFKQSIGMLYQSDMNNVCI